MSVHDRLKQTAEGFRQRIQRDLEAALDELVAELARAAEDEHATAVAEATARLSEELRTARAEAEHALQQQIERVRQEALEAARDTVSADLERLKADVERLRAELAHATAAADAARRAREQAEESFELERARAALESQQALESSVMAAVSDERQAQLQAVERTLGVVRRLDRGRSLTDVLTALGEGVSAEGPRTAIFTVHGDRVRSWRWFGVSPTPPAVELERRAAGVLTRAIEQGDIVFTEPAASGQSSPVIPGVISLPSDRVALAIPIHVGGEVVAVLYADDATEAAAGRPAAWPEVVEILTRHAALRLENLTAVRTAQALGGETAGRAAAAGRRPGLPASGAAAVGEEEVMSARRYARLLVSEIKLYNESAVRLGREHGDLADRLREEIARARRLYEARVPAHVRAIRPFFDEELVETLAGGDATRLGPRVGQAV